MPASGPDRLARLLEIGLVAILLAAPLPFGSVIPAGLRVLEIAVFVLGGVWVIRALRAPTALPPRLVWIPMIALLALGSLQLAPLPAGWVAGLSPEAERIRAMEHNGPADEAELRLLDTESSAHGAESTLSVFPRATASTLRTASAAVLVLLIAFTVAERRGASLMCTALLVSAAFQALYGLIVLASGWDHIWTVPKRAYLDAATGTFVNRNHFACFLAMSLPCGAAVVVRQLRTAPAGGIRPLARWFAARGARAMLGVPLLLIGLAGLLASTSRAGTALGLIAIGVSLIVVGRLSRGRLRIAVVALLVVIAAVPLIQLGPERTTDRFARSIDDITRPGARLTVWNDTLSMAALYPAAGAGLGTFESAYPLYRSPEVRLLYAHAHNDLLQYLAESGILGALLLAAWLVAVLPVVWRGLRGRAGSLGVGLAAGLAAVLLHSLVDFNLHIPANLMTAAGLVGALHGVSCKRRG